MNYKKGIIQVLKVYYNRKGLFSNSGDENKMAILGNSLYRQTQNKQESAAEKDQQIARLEEDIRKLKIDFDIYFNGAAKRAPLEARARLESNIKRIADDRNLTFAQRYQYNMVVARFTSYRELWRRMLKTKGEELV